MNWAHVHLLLNHIPVIGIGFGILLLAAGWVRKSEEVKRIGLQFFVLLGVLTLPVYLTGEPAQKIVQALPGVSKQIIEQHEEAALLALIAMSILGLFALVGLILFRQREVLPSWVVTTSFILSLVVGVLMARTANLGGQVRHTEIRSGLTPAASTAAPRPNSSFS
jgi:uncharacterized membrane protein